MKLQVKISCTVILALLFSGACVATLFNRVILKEFEVLEDTQVLRNYERLIEGWQVELRGLSSIARDWGMWDDAFDYVSNQNDTFEKLNLNYLTLAPLEISHIGFVDVKLKPIFQAALDNSEQALTPAPDGLLEILQKSGFLTEAINSYSATAPDSQPPAINGFIQVGDTNFLIAARAVTDGAGTQASAGAIWMLREVSPALLSRIEKQTKLSLQETLVHLDSVQLASSQVVSSESAFSKPAIQKVDQSVFAQVYCKDIFGKEVLKLQISTPREVFAKGVQMKTFILVGFFIITCLTAALVIFLLHSLIVAPINRLGSNLLSICNSNDFSSRVVAHGNDELGTLGRQINQTLSALQEAIVKAEVAQHQAESANAAKSSFIAKVSHELRTPIHSITGMLRILLKEERSSAKRNYIMMARNSAYGLLETINEILDFSKAEAGKLLIEQIKFSIHDVIREAIQTVGPRVEEKGSLELIVQVPQGLPNSVLGDPLRLKQVLVNLLGNATKFTKEGHIGLAVGILGMESDRIDLEITIFDTGIGIPADRIEHIFEPFGQVDESISRMFTGTGLGLTIVKQLVDGMNGNVRVASTVGKGSQFILTIPFPVPAYATPVVYKPILSSKRIALVDGHSTAVERFAHELEDNGYIPEIICCDDSDELDILSRSLQQYGLIIVTSSALKRSRIFDLVVELRGRESVPVVSILSPFEISVRERLFALEVPFVVTRPIPLLDILGVVNGDISLNGDGWDDSEDASLETARPLEVLIADDAQTNRIILTELLREAGHQVVCVENGVDLLAQVQESFQGTNGTPKFDLILTDVQMPLLDGLNATSRIRDLERDMGREARLPVVAVTAHAMTDEVSRMRNFGVDDVVTKPLDPLRLGQVIQRLTGQEQASQNKLSEKSTTLLLSEDELSELGLRIWRQIAERDVALAELFSLSEDPQCPEDFQRVLDIADVIERSGNSVRRTLLIFNGFVDCFREQLQKLRAAKNAGNLEQLRFASHALKGLLLDIGARASAGLASSIEQLCKQGEEKAFAHVNLLEKQTLQISRLVTQIHDIASGKGGKSARAAGYANSPQIDPTEQD
jgi:signal transduction histidine kinase/CheY-like chemotaxis protein